jgi:hypothetical protein
MPVFNHVGNCWITVMKNKWSLGRVAAAFDLDGRADADHKWT